MYYQLRPSRVSGGLYRTRAPDLGLDVDWLSGERHPEPISTPIQVMLDDEYGTHLADLMSSDILLMSKQMLEGVRSAGVDNVDTYGAVLLDVRSGRRFYDFLAVQIIGRVDAVDTAASVAHDPMGVRHTMVQYRTLCIDENRARGLRLFRLLQSASTIVVDEQVRLALVKLPLQYVELEPLPTST